jgi:hypothetical protein
MMNRKSLCATGRRAGQRWGAAAATSPAIGVGGAELRAWRQRASRWKKGGARYPGP